MRVVLFSVGQKLHTHVAHVLSVTDLFTAPVTQLCRHKHATRSFNGGISFVRPVRLPSNQVRIMSSAQKLRNKSRPEVSIIDWSSMQL